MKEARLPISFAIGSIATGAMYALSSAAADSGRGSLSRALWWHGQLLADFAVQRAGTPDDPSPGLAKLLSFPLGLILYGAAAYALLSFAGRKSK